MKKPSRVSERISKSDLSDVERVADDLFDPVDIEFSKHFFDRVNDPRNGTPIDVKELKLFFFRLIKDRERFEKFLSRYGEFVATDKRSKINIPFVHKFGQKIDQLFAKTVMRKNNFMSTSPVYNFEGKKMESKKVKGTMNFERNRVNESIKHYITVDTPKQITSNSVRNQIEKLAKQGARSKEIGLKMRFVGDSKLAIDAFQRVKNKVYFELDESVQYFNSNDAVDSKTYFVYVHYKMVVKNLSKEAAKAFARKKYEELGHTKPIKVGAYTYFPKMGKMVPVFYPDGFWKKPMYVYRESNQPRRNRVNESPARVKELSRLTGLRTTAIQAFVDKHNIDVYKLLMALGQGNQPHGNRKDFVTAIAGIDGNPYQKRIIRQFGLKESVRESTQPIWENDEYDKYFKGMLAKYKVDSPADLSDEQKSKFFDEVDKGWKAKNEMLESKIRRMVRQELKRKMVESTSRKKTHEMNLADWKEFYRHSKDTSGYDPSYEKKYGNMMRIPHIYDALDKASDFREFIRMISRFETIKK